MSTESDIAALERTVAIDVELLALGEMLAQENAATSEKREMQDQLDVKLGAQQTSIESMERMRNELMQEVRQMSMQVERSREKLARCRTEREANAAQREVEEIRKLYRDRELEIEKLVGLGDQARGELEATTSQRNTLLDELGSSKDSVAAKVARIEAEISAKRIEREAAIVGVTPALLRKYDMIRKRRGTALCHTVDGSCSACHMQLPPMTFQSLMRDGRIDQCPSCQRLIYFRRDAPAAQRPSDGA